MADPLDEKIAQNLKTTLETITRAAGYNQTVAEVHRLTALDGFDMTHLHVVMVEEAPEREREGAPAGCFAWRKTFSIVCCVRPSDDDESPIDAQLNRFAADVVKAVMADRTRGGFAIETDVLDPIDVTDKDGVVEGRVVPVEVTYRHLDTDPYTQIS